MPDDEFLHEIDLILSDLNSPNSVASPSGGARTAAPDWREDVPDEATRWGEPSPYLEERLNAARSAAGNLTAEVRRFEESLAGLKGDLATIDRELGRAHEELTFYRQRETARSNTNEAWPEGPPPSPGGPATAPSAKTGGGSAPSAGRPRSDPPSGSYPDYTVNRYNQTVAALHDRRRSIGWGTIVIAIGISALLLVLTLRAHEPMPTIWLAVLPVVWMVPVPFFVAAFRGTQRVLQENRLELPEQP